MTLLPSGRIFFSRLRRAVWHLLRRIWRADRLYTFRLPCGARFDYPLDSAIGKFLFCGGFEAAELEFTRQHVKAGDIVLDVGANGGLYTVVMARLVGLTGHVYAFEPGARALKLLRHNIAVNELTNVTVIAAAVSNTTGQASFAVADDTAMSSLADIQRRDQRIESWSTVDTIRLDDAAEQHGIIGVSFLKVDVEGAEKLVFEGATRLLTGASRPFAVLFEAAERNARAFGYTVPELLESLQMLGFSVRGFDANAELRPVDSCNGRLGAAVYNFVAFKT